MIARHAPRPFVIDEAHITVVDGAGNTYQSVGDKQMGHGWQLGSTGTITVFTGDPSGQVEYELGLVYAVSDTSVDQAFTLYCPNAPPVAFTVAEITTTQEPVSYKWDDTGEVDGLRITVSEPVREKRLHAEDMDGRRLDATYKVLVAKVVLESVTDKPHIYAASYFMLTDDQGGTYLGYDEDPAYLSDRTPMRSGYIDPQDTITRWLTFVVPIAAAGASISYSQDGSFVKNVQAVWQIVADSS